MLNRRAPRLSRLFIVAGLIAAAPAAVAGTNVLTYHNDALRTGWNNTETVLTPAVANLQVQLQHSVTLDAQVDAQPLVVTGLTIPSKGVHDVVYVATENNTIYALDAYTGLTLATRNFGTPVPMASLPGQCNTNAPTVGIGATPTIDLAANTMYVIADTFESGHAIFRIHAIDLITLADKVTPTVVSATQPLGNGSPYSFQADFSRSRAALLEANGNIYAAFSSYCDFSANLTRGWVLGWQASTLTPLAKGDLVDRVATSTDTFFLTSVWMSGAGLAADQLGKVYFSTGNSDPTGTSFRATGNLEESVVRLSPNLAQVQGFFTPTNYKTLDANDNDIGAGGVTLLPAQPGLYPNLAVIAGKTGPLYLLNRDKLGSKGTTGIMSTGTNNGCWCMQSYFTGADGVGRIVTSTGNNEIAFKVVTSATGKPLLVQDFAGNTGIMNGQDPGFFTSISSNGTTAGSYVIWAVSRPVNSNPGSIQLYAFDGTDGHTILNIGAGSWPNTSGNANIVPTVANGHVYVAANKTLDIFGAGPGAASVSASTVPTVQAAAIVAPTPDGHAVSGIIETVDGGTITIKTRAGSIVTVNAGVAIADFKSAILSPGRAVLVRGAYDAAGLFQATAILRAKDSPAAWEADR